MGSFIAVRIPGTLSSGRAVKLADQLVDPYCKPHALERVYCGRFEDVADDYGELGVTVTPYRVAEVVQLFRVSPSRAMLCGDFDMAHDLDAAHAHRLWERWQQDYPRSWVVIYYAKMTPPE